MTIYQLIAWSDKLQNTLIITEDTARLYEAISLAVGAQDWSLDDLTVSIWRHGQEVSATSVSDDHTLDLVLPDGTRI